MTTEPVIARTTASDRSLHGAGAGQLSIDLGVLRANWRMLDARARPGRAAAVVKADAYGLGTAPVVSALHAEGCQFFFTAHPAEAAEVREVAPDVAVAALNGSPPGLEADLLAAGVVPVLNTLAALSRWRRLAQTLGRRLPALIQIDTGINRLGLEPDEVERMSADPDHHLAGLDVRLWLTHLACADSPDHPMTRSQADRVLALARRLPSSRWSVANSAGMFRALGVPDDLSRPGAALYGLKPCVDMANPMQPVVSLSAPVLQVRRVDAGEGVGYGAAHLMARRGRIATLAIGYADGYLRSLSGSGAVYWRSPGGHVVTAPVVGRVSMDLLTVDVTDLPDDAPQQGDLLEVIGPHRDVDRIATEAGTIGYEILTALGRRYRRAYIGRVEAPAGRVPVPVEAAWSS